MIGAGTAGLAAAATLRGAGVDVIVIEQTDKVGAAWRTRYDGLRLKTTGWMSTQPGFRASRRRYGEFRLGMRGLSISRTTLSTTASMFALARRSGVWIPSTEHGTYTPTAATCRLAR